MRDEYKPVQFETGGSSEMRQQLASRDLGREAFEERRRRLVEHHIAHSTTRRLLDIVFMTAIICMMVTLLLGFVGMAGMLKPLSYVLLVYQWPLQFWQPDPQRFELGPISLDKKLIVSLVLYTVAYVGLRKLHRRISEDRTYVPDL